VSNFTQWRESGKPVFEKHLFTVGYLFVFGLWLRLVLRMKENQHRFLSLLGQLPLRLNAEQAGWVLNCQPHDLPALIHARLLKPLGNPSANGTKYFATADLLEIAKDRAWLVKVTTTINTHWQRQNANKRTPAANNRTTEFELPAIAGR
jgi:hypothetical protein